MNHGTLYPGARTGPFLNDQFTQKYIYFMHNSFAATYIHMYISLWRCNRTEYWILSIFSL